MRTRILIIPLLLLVVGTSGCAGRSKEIESATIVDEIDIAAEENALRSIIRDELDREANVDSAPRARLRYSRPFYYREFFEFPGGTSAVDLEMVEKEQRTAPLGAHAVVPKTRFATKLHKKKDDAQMDAHFYRDTGTEYISYELSNGQWRRLGSLYVAETTESFENGQWQVAYREADYSMREDAEEKGFFGRTWDAITFWN